MRTTENLRRHDGHQAGLLTQLLVSKVAPPNGYVHALTHDDGRLWVSGTDGFYRKTAGRCLPRHKPGYSLCTLFQDAQRLW
ncbi:hypothetical protein [Hymenobacter sp.]|uniref:hypothetical protein n=1 Tax=Hymenobacter sp. TaxID=1898978 RepID=UPI002ED8D8AD